MTTNPMCRCAELTDRGCFVHDWRAPEITMAFAVGYVDGANNWPPTWRDLTEAEQEAYRMGRAVATGRYRKEGVA